MDKHIKTNLLRWNEAVDVHVKSDFYNVDGFLQGESTLKPIEMAALGDVRGKSILHLQCHFGLDTLSLARMGAKVTGVDFSIEAINMANKLSKEIDVEARFICSDVLSLGHVLNEEFDIVFTSYGVLCWIRDIKEWGRVIGHFVKPGGVFFMVDGHPISHIMEFNEDTGDYYLKYDYFAKEPSLCSSPTSYADSKTQLENTNTYQWDHTISDVITALIAQGLKITELKEYPFAAYEKFPGQMIKDPDGWWRINSDLGLPLLFSIKATK